MEKSTKTVSANKQTHNFNKLHDPHLSMRLHRLCFYSEKKYSVWRNARSRHTTTFWKCDSCAGRWRKWNYWILYLMEKPPSLALSSPILNLSSLRNCSTYGPGAVAVAVWLFIVLPQNLVTRSCFVDVVAPGITKKSSFDGSGGLSPGFAGANDLTMQFSSNPSTSGFTDAKWKLSNVNLPKKEGTYHWLWGRIGSRFHSLDFGVGQKSTQANGIVQIGRIRTISTVKIEWFDCSFWARVVLQASVRCCECQVTKGALKLNQMAEHGGSIYQVGRHRWQ